MKTILILLSLATLAAAFPAKLRWNKNAPDEGVTEYRVWKWTDGIPALVATVPAVADAEQQQSHAMELQGREVLTVTAFNGFESDHSDQVTVPVKPTKPGGVEVIEVTVTVRVSSPSP